MRTFVVLVLLAAALTACTTSGPEPERLTVLASSELADMAPVLDDLRRETGVDLALDFQGTVEASNALTPGQYRHDLAWLSSDRYFKLKLKQSGFTGPEPLATDTMQSPLVVGVRPDKGKSLPGNGKPSWADIAEQAAAGGLKFAMADPHSSSSGLAALIGVATAAAGTGTSLRPEDVQCDKLGGFFTGRTLTSPTSTGLVEEFLAHPGDADAIVNYESVLLKLNEKLPEPLRIIYPRDGIVLSEYPLLLLDPAKRAAYDRVVAWLRQQPVQRSIMERTGRRPVDPAVSRTEPLREPIGNALYFPDRQEVVDTLLSAYDQATSGAKRHVVYVLDYSTSMRGARVDGLRKAFDTLIGAGGFDRFHLGEQITVVRFAGQVLDERTVTVTGPADLDSLRTFVASDDLRDGTAIWSALEHVYRTVHAPASVVLMTDGENNAGVSVDQALAAAPKDVHTYAIRFGEADPSELARAGRVVDATTTSLLDALKELRGCR